jgi:hypothetical protein
MRIDEFKAMIQEIVSEELDNMLLTERVVGTKKTRKKGTGKSGRGTFTSAGTIPPGLKYKKGSMTRSQIQAREKIGTKMLNAITRSNKDPKAAKFRTSLESQLQKKGLGANRPNMYSQVWAEPSGVLVLVNQRRALLQRAKVRAKAKQELLHQRNNHRQRNNHHRATPQNNSEIIHDSLIRTCQFTTT